MRVAPISFSTVSRPQQRKTVSHRVTQETPQPQEDSVNFKGNAGKIIGAVLGTAAIVVAAPAVAIVGLAGIGTLAGAIAGNAVDEKLEEKEEKKNKKKDNH